jgi:hypothetical protein
MERKNDREQTSRIPENDPSKAMDSKREVERANDPNIDEDFPGYPHYPAKEDIMDQRTDTHRVDMDVENLPSGHNATGVSQRFVTSQEADRNSDLSEQSDEADQLEVLDSRDSEIGAPQNVSNEDAGTNLPGTDVLDEIENMDRDNDNKRS